MSFALPDHDAQFITSVWKFGRVELNFWSDEMCHRAFRAFGPRLKRQKGSQTRRDRRISSSELCLLSNFARYLAPRRRFTREPLLYLRRGIDSLRPLSLPVSSAAVVVRPYPCRRSRGVAVVAAVPGWTGRR